MAEVALVPSQVWECRDAAAVIYWESRWRLDLGCWTRGSGSKADSCCAWSQACASTFGCPCMQPYLCDQIQELSSHCRMTELQYCFAVIPTVLCECDQEYTFRKLFLTVKIDLVSIRVVFLMSSLFITNNIQRLHLIY